MFPQLIFTYQIILKNLTEVLNQDHDFLKKVTQPKQVKEQGAIALAQLNRELKKTGKAIKPLLDTNLTTQNREESAGDQKRKNEGEKDSVSKKAKLDEDDNGIVCLDDDIVEIEEGQRTAKKAKLAAATSGATVAKPVTKEDSELVCID